MSQPASGIPQELQELVAAACDGDLSERQTERLEQLLADSLQARQYYLLYLHLHGELHWHQAMAGEMPDLAAPSAEGKGLRIPTPGGAAPRRDRFSRLRLVGFCLCALVAVSMLALAYYAMPHRKLPSPPAPPVAVASGQLADAVQPRWEPGSTPPAIGQPVPLDRRLVLERGVIQISHPDGTRVFLQGPSAFRYSSSARIELESGRATVIAADKPELVIEAGGAAIESTDGPVGVFVDQAGVEVHGLGGTARVLPLSPQPPAPAQDETRVGPDQAVQWALGAASVPRPIPVDRQRFALSLPDRAPGRSVARMRDMVANHPRLIRHYTFEGTSRLEKCQDKRGADHLTEAVMAGGRGRGSIDYTAQGLDLTTEAIRPHREPQGGNECGVALQSEAQFHPPAAMTVELLLSYEVPPDANDETVALAVSTRQPDRGCGFYVAAVGKGHLSLLLDSEADWVEMDTLLTPERWYYVAVTFQAGEKSTLVNAYVADLTDDEPQLRRVLDNDEVQSVPSVSRLGIGKGFDSTGAHAYPWSGALDEVALYDTVLDQQELERHVDLLRAGGSGSN
ncbi:MAG: LamG-like jellyroll fold domain-containing protein [Thermoguttaceae bacterium]